MRAVISAWGPDQEDDSGLPHAQALQSEFTVSFAIIFHCDHRIVEDRFQASKINLVLPEVLFSLRLVPSDHLQNVYAFCASVNQYVDAGNLGMRVCWLTPAFRGAATAALRLPSRPPVRDVGRHCVIV